MIWKTKSLSLSYNCHVYQLPFRKLKSYSTRENWLQQFAPIAVADNVFCFYTQCNKTVYRFLLESQIEQLRFCKQASHLLLSLDYLKGLLKCVMTTVLVHNLQMTDPLLKNYCSKNWKISSTIFFFSKQRGLKDSRFRLPEPRLKSRRVGKSSI